MTGDAARLMPWLGPQHQPTGRQQVFLRHLTATLIDLVVLGLFAQYWEAVTVSSFTIALIAAMVLQSLLKVTIAAEHLVLGRLRGKAGAGWKTARLGSAWLILFSSKFLMLWALELVLGDRLVFHGAYHGVLAFIAVVSTMLVAEEVVVRIYRGLG